MNNKSALASLEKLESYIEKLEKENEELKVRLGKRETKTEFPNNETVDAAAFDCLCVSQVQVFPFKEGTQLGHLKGLAQIVLNDQMVIRGLRIMEGENGLFVSYPIDQFYKGDEFRSVVKPTTRSLREHIEAVVIEKYQQAIEA